MIFLCRRLRRGCLPLCILGKSVPAKFGQGSSCFRARAGFFRCMAAHRNFSRNSVVCRSMSLMSRLSVVKKEVDSTRQKNARAQPDAASAERPPITIFVAITSDPACEPRPIANAQMPRLAPPKAEASTVVYGSRRRVRGGWRMLLDRGLVRFALFVVDPSSARAG